MRNLTFAALAGSALALAACSGAEDTTVDETATADAGTMETAETVATDSVMNANDVTEEQLAGMSGVSPELAAAIVAGQPYDSATAFNSVLMETLSEDEAATVRETLFVPVNLNDASEEDIRLIPGMTDRMVGEFQEYRPYENMDEFNREIGKYVDEQEVARFRNYVTL